MRRDHIYRDFCIWRDMDLNWRRARARVVNERLCCRSCGFREVSNRREEAKCF
jgi:hypothetical protein